MTYALDPLRDWEVSWEVENPEPYPEPKTMSKNILSWTTQEMLERVQWHQRRWLAYKLKFPQWQVASYGI
jgi:hypothetical protein